MARRDREAAIRVLLLGAEGHLGRRVRDVVSASGLVVVGVGRGASPDLVEADDVVVNVATDDGDVVRAWAAAGARARGYVDANVVAGDPGPVSGAPVVPAAGWLAGVGDALAVVASEQLAAPVRADVTAWVPARRSLLANATRREAHALWRAVWSPMTVLEDGQRRRARIAEDRHLAWFPRPVGPHHAAVVPGPHDRTLPQVVPSLQTVRTALALSSWAAELLQGMGNLSRLRERPPAPRRDSGSGTTGERWAIVAEVATADGEIVRGWANGLDRHAVTARVLGETARRLLEGAGSVALPVVGVTEVVPAADLLDGLAATTGLRWSITG